MTKTKTGPTERKQVAKEATVRKGSSTRDAIVKLALRMIAEKGVAGTSVLEITQTLGISNGTFYYHFVNMEQLLEDVGLRVVASLIEESKQARRPDPAAQ